MGENILILDLETKSVFGDHADRRPGALGVSVVGTYCYKTDTYRCYPEVEIPALELRLTERPLVVGFNIRRFDFPVLKPYLHFDASTLPMCDMLEIIHKLLGHRVSLESVAQATLGTGKSGDGLDAVRYYQQGEMEKLIQYCMDDIKVTKAVYEYGVAHGEVFYLKKFDKAKARVPVAWELKHPEAEGEASAQMGLFA